MDGLLATGPRHRWPAVETLSPSRLIWDAIPPYNAGSCRGGALLSARHGRPTVRLPYFGCGRRALEANKSEIDAVVGSGHMLGALDFMPAAAVDGGKRRIAVAASVHQRDQQPVGERQRLRIDVAAPGHHDGVGAAAQRIAARGGKRGVEPAGDDRTRRREAVVAADHDGGAPL